MGRAAMLDPDTNIVLNMIVVGQLWILPNLVWANEGGNIGDLYIFSPPEFVPPTDPRHPYYIAPPPEGE